MEHKIRVGITQGDVNGIGMEIIVRAFGDESLLKHFIPVLYASPRAYVYTKKAMAAKGFDTVNFHPVTQADEAKAGRLNLIATSEEPVEIKFGEPSETTAADALKALKMCVEDAAAGKLDAILTAPLDKATVAARETGFNGHTGYIAKGLGVDNYAMMLIAENLRVALMTDHVPLKDVSTQLSKERISDKIRLLHASMQRDFGIPQPRIAVLGLNPHAGDNGLLGEEENAIIKPAVDSCMASGILAYGPYPADSFFGSGKEKQFDVVLAMYHDQGLIPFKSEAFYDGVNFTAGLPVVRTSPDHGTAYDLAGKGEASLMSFMNALFDAITISKQRQAYDDGRDKFLPFAELKRERFRIDF